MSNLLFLSETMHYSVGWVQPINSRDDGLHPSYGDSQRRSIFG